MKKHKDISPFNLAGIFDFISLQTQEVIWICNNDYSEQLYLSPAFEGVWGLEREAIYEHRDIFPTTILKEDLTNLMPDFIARQQGNCNDTLAYRVRDPTGKIAYVKDTCIGITDKNGHQIALLGLAKPVTLQEWQTIKLNPQTPEPSYKNILNRDLAGIISQSLKLNCILPGTSVAVDNKDGFKILTNQQYINLSKREAECLFHLLKGKTFKMIAKDLTISPRTVETHLVKIKEKLGCGKVIELVSKIENRKQIDKWIF